MCSNHSKAQLNKTTKFSSKKKRIMENPTHCPYQCVTNNTTGIKEQQCASNLIASKADIITTCYRIHPCAIQMEIFYWKRVFTIMERINIQASAIIYTKISGYSERRIEPNKENFKIHTNTHPNHNEIWKLKNMSCIWNSCGCRKSLLIPNR